jgi:hypothetical protein
MYRLLPPLARISSHSPSTFAATQAWPPAPMMTIRGGVVVFMDGRG